MPLIDPTLTSLLQRSAFWPMREIPALKSAILDANSEAFSCEHRMKRRDFIMLVGGAMVCPYGGTAQASNRMFTIGILSAGSPNSTSHLYTAFFKELRELAGLKEATLSLSTGMQTIARSDCLNWQRGWSS